MTDTMGFAPDKLTRRTLNDQVYAQLKEAIVSGRLMPGRVLTIRELADSFGVSMMPVREALSRLIAEQILVLRPNRSVALPVLTTARFDEIMRVRLLLERHAAVEGARAITPAQIAAMAELNERMAMTRPGDRQGYLDLNRQFHFVIYRASGLDYTVGLIEAMWAQIGPSLNFLLDGSELARHSSPPHHDRLLEALRRRDPEAAGDAVFADIRDAAQVIHDIMERKAPRHVPA